MTGDDVMLVQNCSVAFSVYLGYYSLQYLIYLLPAIILTVIAQTKVKSTYNKYSRIPNVRRITGEMAARAVLSAHGITDVKIERVRGTLSDHYSPTEKVIRLSEGVYSSATVAAVGIAAHEAGHAVQHAEGYIPNKIRSAVIPAANISSRLAVPIILVGLLLPTNASNASNAFVWAGISAYSLAVLVYLVTLPVEFNASRRALDTIKSGYLLESTEYDGAKKMLTAAAMTYVASALTALIQFLRLLFIVGNRRD